MDSLSQDPFLIHSQFLLVSLRESGSRRAQRDPIAFSPSSRLRRVCGAPQLAANRGPPRAPRRACAGVGRSSGHLFRFLRPGFSSSATFCSSPSSRSASRDFLAASSSPRRPPAPHDPAATPACGRSSGSRCAAKGYRRRHILPPMLPDPLFLAIARDLPAIQLARLSHSAIHPQRRRWSSRGVAGISWAVITGLPQRLECLESSGRELCPLWFGLTSF